MQWSGTLRGDAGRGWGGVAAALTTTESSVMAVDADAGVRSRYSERFAQGATISPRVLHVVDRVPAPGGLGLPSGVVHVRSNRSTIEKLPWRSLPDREATVEDRFVFDLHRGDTLVPFRVLEPENVVIPWDGKRMLDGGSAEIDRYPLLASWWREGERLWREVGHSDSMTLLERLDYHRSLQSQFPPAPSRVVYTAHGTALAAGRVIDSTAVINNKLYWAATQHEDEALYLVGVLNAPETTRRVGPLQSRGLFGARDFHKYVWWLPVPEFSPSDPGHSAIVDAARRAESVAQAVDLTTTRSFQAARKKVRDSLTAAGITEALDALVVRLLA